MGVMKTPGVYIVEKNAFPNSVVEVATAVPAFIGYTEKAMDGNKSLTGKPKKISSMAEFQYYFGGSPLSKLKFSVKEADAEALAAGESPVSPFITIGEGENKKVYTVAPADAKKRYTLFFHMQFFFANGGGPCYIVSVGDYDSDITEEALKNGITPLLKEQEPTLVVVPEAVQMANVDSCANIQQAMLKHCGNDLLRNRIAIFDIYDGYKDKDSVTAFREKIGTEFMSYAAAYYPWINTSIITENSITFDNAVIEDLQEALKAELAIRTANIDKTISLTKDEEKVAQLTATKEKLEAVNEEYSAKLTEELDATGKSNLHNTFMALSPLYADIMKEIRNVLNLLPPSSAMAGIYTLVDNTRGVWKAPANVGVTAAISPAVSISHQEQEDLNVDNNGKSINAIRFFTGEGIKVWGARTLDGNSLDWRYINVRRTMIMLEESIKNASRAFVFDPNDANTWVNMKSMINNFLNGIWKRGGLAGSSPGDAYSVFVGLGETMTPEDILEGILRITVLVAITRPAEFIEITFQQQMQKS